MTDDSIRKVYDWLLTLAGALVALCLVGAVVLVIFNLESVIP